MMTVPTATSADSPWKTRWALIIGAVIVFLLNFVTSLSQQATYPDGTPEGEGRFYGEIVGMLLASAFFLPTLVWAAIWFAFIRPSRRKVGAKYYWILVAVGLAASLPMAWLTISRLPG